jgi:hypothetical protein
VSGGGGMEVEGGGMKGGGSSKSGQALVATLLFKTSSVRCQGHRPSCEVPRTCNCISSPKACRESFLGCSTHSPAAAAAVAATSSMCDVLQA